jgi:heptosyltransferase-2
LRYQHLIATWLGGPLTIDPECRLQIAADVVDSIRAQRTELPPQLLAMNPGATYGTAKCWLPERYAALALEARRARGVGVIIVGGAGDVEVCARVAAMIAAEDPTSRHWCRNLAGTTTIGALAAWLRETACLVTNDTGAMHVAAAVGTPLVAIFGPTDWRETAPLGTRHTLLRAEHVACAPCCKRTCAIDHRCMTAISVAQVWQAVQPWLDTAAPSAAPCATSA